MASISSATPTRRIHVAAVPYPGRGHVNALMNLCKLLVTRKRDVLISFIVTEEWLGFIGGDPKPDNIRFATIPNVIPSEIGRAKDFPGFVRSVNTEMQAPTERLLGHLQPRVTAIVADTFVTWAVQVGNRLNIPVASLWPMSATVFSILYHFELLVENGHFPAELSERGAEFVDYIPGVSKSRLADLPTFFTGDGLKTRRSAVEAARSVQKAQYLLSTSVYELESHTIDVLKASFPFPVYTIGPSAPYFELESSPTTADGPSNYLQWLNSQAEGSVLYVSQGSFLSVSSTQMEEIVGGVRDSGVRFLWVARGDDSRFKGVNGEVGLVVPWCDQLRVLCHPSVGGFWTHAGWNSTLEAVFAGVPMLACPIFWDQIPNSKKIVEDWKVGIRLEAVGGPNLVRREEIAEIVKRFMNPESVEGREMRKRMREYRGICRGAVAKGGSSYSNIDSFLRDISDEQ